METVQTANPPSFESVWATLDRIAKRQEEAAEEQRKWQEKAAEERKETDRMMKENAKRQEKAAEEQRKRQEEFERQKKETDKQLGKLGNRFGEMVEYMVKPNLEEKFRELGYVFTKTYNQTEIKDKKNNIITEVDITLENGDKVMLVEVKSKPTTEDITDHIERMEKVRTHASLRNDNRKYLGAIAGVVMNQNEKTFALKSGFYVVEPSGETFNITAPEGIYSPREW